MQFRPASFLKTYQKVRIHEHQQHISKIAISSNLAYPQHPEMYFFVKKRRKQNQKKKQKKKKKKKKKKENKTKKTKKKNEVHTEIGQG